MELRQLRYFLKIADLGSVSKASQALHIAQPALSQQMSQLESELGQKLFTRLSIGVRMTEHGETFYSHAQRVLRQIDDIRVAVSSLERNPSGTVRIGLPQSTAVQYALPLIEESVRRFPAVKLEFFDEITGTTLQGLNSGRLDFAIIVNDEDAALLDAIPVLYEQLFLISRSDQAPKGDSISAPELARLPLSVPSSGQGSRTLLDAFLSEHGAAMPEVPVLANSINIMRHSMLAGLAHTVMPWGAVSVELAAGVLKATPTAPVLKRKVYLATARTGELSFAAQATHDLLLSIIQQRVVEGSWPGVIAL